MEKCLGLMESHMKGSGKIIKWTEKELSDGLMAVSMREIIYLIKEMALET